MASTRWGRFLDLLDKFRCVCVCVLLLASRRGRTTSKGLHFETFQMCVCVSVSQKALVLGFLLKETKRMLPVSGPSICRQTLASPMAKHPWTNLNFETFCWATTVEIIADHQRLLTLKPPIKLGQPFPSPALRSQVFTDRFAPVAKVTLTTKQTNILKRGGPFTIS